MNECAGPRSLFPDEQGLGLLTDLYELTMAAAYDAHGMAGRWATFELWVRRLPEKRNYLVAAGLDQAVHYLRSLRFSDEQINYLHSLPDFDHVPAAWFEHLRGLRFTGDLWAVPEGTAVFAGEPLLRVTAPIMEAQIAETYLITTITMQTLIASKAARVVSAAAGRPVIDFGSRRAHGPQAGLLAARAAFLGGCARQTALVGAPFAQPLAVTVSSAYHDPVGGGQVTFTSPTSGASAVLTGSPATIAADGTASVTATANSSAGPYSVTASATGAASAVTFALRNIGTQTITFAPLPDKIYGDAPINLGATASSGLAVTYTIAGPASLASNALTITGAGTVAITAHQAGDANYLPAADATQTFNLAKALLTVTADDAPSTPIPDTFFRDYGAANPAFTARYEGFVLGQDASVLGGVLTLTTLATISSGVGSYLVTPSGLTSDNYAISFYDGTLTVTPVALDITASDRGKIYGTTLDQGTTGFTEAGLVTANGDTITGVTLTSSGAAASTSASPPSYAITASAAVGSGLSNYMITYHDGALTVNKAALTVAADNKTKTYGTANPPLTATVSGLMPWETPAVVSGLTLSTPATDTSPVGTYAITASGASAANYTISYVAGALTVMPAPLTITAVDKTKVYGGANPALTATYSGLVAGDTEAVVSNLTLNTSATTTSGVGVYTITASAATAANYAISYMAGALTVTSAPLTIEAVDKTKVYGSANPTLTASYAGFAAGDTEAVVSGLNLTTPATTTSGVGSYTITASGATAANYTISCVAGALTVTPAPLTITAVDKAKVYGSANPTLTPTYSGFVLGEMDSVVSGLTLSTMATTASGVGTYAITAGGASAANYSISYVAGVLTVTPAPLTITAADKTKVYGSANPTLTASYAGLVAGDTEAAVIGLTLNTTATTTSGVGTYAITALGASAANYSISYMAGLLTVKPAPLTITASDQAVVYGDPLPTLTVAYAGPLPWDTPAVVTGLVISTTAAAGSPPGTYAITAAGASAANYTVAYQSGTLTISPAPAAPAASPTPAAPPAVGAPVAPASTAELDILFALAQTAPNLLPLALGPATPAGTLTSPFDLGAVLAGNRSNFTWPSLWQVSGGSRTEGALVLTGVPAAVNTAPGEVVTFTAVAQLDGRPVAGLSYWLEAVPDYSFPEGAMIDLHTGEFAWEPGEVDETTVYAFVIKTGDGINVTEQVVTVTVEKSSSALTLLGVPGDAVVRQGEPLTFEARALAGRSPAPAATFAQEAVVGRTYPAGAAIDLQSGTFVWQPAERQGAGDYAVRVTARDGHRTATPLVRLTLLASAAILAGHRAMTRGTQRPVPTRENPGPVRRGRGG